MTIISQLASDFTDFLSRWWIIIALVILLVVMYVFSAKRRKDYNNQVIEMLNSLRPGDKIKTIGGFYGTIVSIKETTDGKVVLLEMGEGSKVSYMSIDANAIYGVDKKEDIVYDKDGNVIEPDDDSDDDKGGKKPVAEAEKKPAKKSKKSEKTSTDLEEEKAEKTQEILEEEAKDIENIDKPVEKEAEEKPEQQKPINEEESKLEDIEKLIGGK